MIIFRYRHTNRHCIIIYISSSSLSLSRQEGSPTFSQFVSYVAEGEFPVVDNDPLAICSLAIYRYLFNPTTIHATGGADPHWNSLTSMCAPCLVDYDWILRLEDPSLEQDSAAFLAFSGMASRWWLDASYTQFHSGYPSQATWRRRSPSPRRQSKSRISSSVDSRSLPPARQDPRHLCRWFPTLWIFCPRVLESGWQQLLLEQTHVEKESPKIRLDLLRCHFEICFLSYKISS